MAMDGYNSCCGKSICSGCVYSFRKPFCNSDRVTKTDKECAEELTKRVKVNNATSIFLLAGYYLHGVNGFQQDRTKAIECTLGQSSLAIVRLIII